MLSCNKEIPKKRQKGKKFTTGVARVLKYLSNEACSNEFNFKRQGWLKAKDMLGVGGGHRHQSFKGSMNGSTLCTRSNLQLLVFYSAGGTNMQDPSPTPKHVPAVPNLEMPSLNSKTPSLKAVKTKTPHPSSMIHETRQYVENHQLLRCPDGSKS